MVADQLRQRIFPLAGQPFQPGGGSRVEASALGSGQGLVRDLADQDVAKGEDVGSGGAKEILLRQLIDELRHSLERGFQGEQSRRTEGASKDGT